MKFNINDKVKVRLTDKGRDELRAQYEDLQLFCTSLKPYQEPVEDAQGYSEWQLWNLMQTFGDLMGSGCDLYFDVEIIIPEPAALPILEQQERGEGDWIEWAGDIGVYEQPVEGMVEVNFRNGVISKRNAGCVAWLHEGLESDIIAYRIIPEWATNQNGEQ